MNINATYINLYRVCKRECWLHANGVQMEHTSELVADGKLIEEESYQQRSERYTQIELSAEFEKFFLTGKIDQFDTKDLVIHENKRIKKDKEEHSLQMKI